MWCLNRRARTSELVGVLDGGVAVGSRDISADEVRGRRAWRRPPHAEMQVNLSNSQVSIGKSQVRWKRRGFLPSTNVTEGLGAVAC